MPSASREHSSSLEEKLTKNGTMTPFLGGTVAADRKRSRVRQGREKIEDMGSLRLLHLGPILSGEGSPVVGVMCRLPQLEELLGWGGLWKPDVIEITRCKVSFRDSTGWPSHRSDA